MIPNIISQPSQALAGGVTNSIGLVINSSNPVSPQNGGSGVSNSFTTTLGGAINTAGAFSTLGANALTLTTTATTSVTLPTSGTLVNSSVATLSSLASIGTITTGVWQGSLIGGQWGGTGVNNGASTITIGGNVAFSGAFTFTGTLTANTSVTFPTTGTLATISANGVATTNVTGTSITMADNAPVNVYVANNAALVTLTLPTTIAAGHVFRIVGSGAGGWKIAQNASQSIIFTDGGGTSTGTTTSGTGGFIQSGQSTDCADLICGTANTTLTLFAAGSLSWN
jgi:trimeric autotransporter adhesin